MQPVASPVDLYYRPQPNDFLKIAQGLSSLAPGLANLSNSIIETIARREAVEGAIEGDRLAAMPDTQNGVATMKQPKLAKAIEDSGGISPWRAQSLLESFGRNTVLQQYSRRIEQEFEDLSNPLGPDGQLRPADYAQRRMGEIFTAVSAAIPQNSYYARKAAEATRAEVDPVVLYKLGQAYVKKTKEEHVRAYVDEGVEALRSGGDEAFRTIIPGLKNRFYRETGQSGDVLVATVLTKHAKIMARSGEAGSAVLLQEVLDEGIDGRPVGAVMREQIEEAIDEVGKIEELQLQRGIAKENRAIDAVKNAILMQVEQMGDTPDANDMRQLIDAELAKDTSGVDKRVAGDLYEWGRLYSTARRREEIAGAEMEARPEVLESVLDELNKMPQSDHRKYLDGLYTNGTLTRSQYERASAFSRQSSDIPSEFNSHVTSFVTSGVDDLAWTGIDKQLIPLDLRSQLETTGGELKKRLRNLAMGVARDPALRAMEDPTARAAAMADSFDEQAAKVLQEFRGKNKGILDKADRSKNYTTTLKPVSDRELETAIESIAARMGVQDRDLGGTPNPAFRVIALAVKREWNTEVRAWYDASSDAEMSVDEIMDAWDRTGAESVTERIMDRFSNPNWVFRQSREVQSAVPVSHLRAAQVRSTGYTQSEMAPFAVDALSVAKNSTGSEPSNYFYRLIYPEADFSSNLKIALRAAEQLKKSPSDATRAEYAEALGQLRAASNAVLAHMTDRKDYIVRPEGVLSPKLSGTAMSPGMTFSWQLNEGVTKTYWSVKLFNGLTAAERAAGKTSEGATIPDAMWRSDVKLFADRADLEQAVRSGEISRIYTKVRQAGQQLTLDEFILQQMGVIQALTPEPTKTDTTPRTIGGLEVILD